MCVPRIVRVIVFSSLIWVVVEIYRWVGSFQLPQCLVLLLIDDNEPILMDHLNNPASGWLDSRKMDGIDKKKGTTIRNTSSGNQEVW